MSFRPPLAPRGLRNDAVNRTSLLFILQLHSMLVGEYTEFIALDAPVWVLRGLLLRGERAHDGARAAAERPALRAAQVPSGDAQPC